MLLLPLLEKSSDGRVVTVSSGMHRSGAINFDDLRSERSYSPTKAYSQSKLANVYFGLELDQRLRAKGSPTKSLISHPGVAVTNLSASLAPGLMKSAMTMFLPLISQSAADGALPSLYATTAFGVQGGQFFGPEGRREMKGSPVEVQPAAHAKDTTIARRLWETSETLTGVKLP
jgi:NAD(P)-dependent dehydrogenase (short-subunit alcohol dehydrogenase family)